MAKLASRELLVVELLFRQVETIIRAGILPPAGVVIGSALAARQGIRMNVRVANGTNLGCPGSGSPLSSHVPDDTKKPGPCQ